jgi:hypothetical protein
MFKFLRNVKDIINYDRETKDICNFLPGILKNQPFGALFIINQKLQVTQKFKSMI